MSEQEARAFMCDLKKLLISKGIWYNVKEENAPDLKFIRFDGAIKIK